MEAILRPKYRKISDLLIHPPKMVKNFFGSITWKINTEKKVIYLTFDDGPIPIITEKILKALDLFNAKATFFCVGENVKKHPSIYNEILAEGHTTGNHTYSHLQGLKTSTKEYLYNIKKAAEYIDSDLFRPPHGRMKVSQQNEIRKNYNIVLWDVLSLDYNKNISEEACLSNVKHFTRPGSVIVFHDSIKAEDNMFYALTQSLMLYNELGYKFETLNSQILKKTKKVRKRVPVFNGLF
ncbi:MAG: polysaccharide deacetylase family protein [Bacteroidales bacterium]|nr:polysaccharide deacetylase family protein [Bacteroidales bacterium]